MKGKTGPLTINNENTNKIRLYSLHNQHFTFQGNIQRDDLRSAILGKNKKLQSSDFQVITAAIFIKPEVLSETKKQEVITKPPAVTTERSRQTRPQEENIDNEEEIPEDGDTNNIKNQEDEEDRINKNETKHTTEVPKLRLTEAAVDDIKKPKTVKLEVTMIMYFIAPGILGIGIVCQVVIAYLNRELLFAYVTQLWYSVANVLIICTAIFAILSDATDYKCIISWFLSMVAIGSLSMANFLMTMYKFILIRFPVGKLEMTTVKKQLMWCCSSFIFVALVSSPMLWLPSIRDHLITARNFCNFKGDEYTYFAVAWVLTVLALPLLLNLSMFFLIGLKVIEHKKKNEARKSRYLPLTQVTSLSTANTGPGEENATLLKIEEKKIKKRGLKTRSTEADNPEVKTPKFPPIIIVTMVITVASTLPFVPAIISPSWFYSKNKIVLDIIYGTMLLSIAISPFVHLWFSKKTKETIVRLGRKFRRFF